MEADFIGEPGGAGTGNEHVGEFFHDAAREIDRILIALQGANGSGTESGAFHDAGIEFDFTEEIGEAGEADGMIVRIRFHQAGSGDDGIKGRPTATQDFHGSFNADPAIGRGNNNASHVLFLIIADIVPGDLQGFVQGGVGWFDQDAFANDERGHTAHASEGVDFFCLFRIGLDIEFGPLDAEFRQAGAGSGDIGAEGGSGVHDDRWKRNGHNDDFSGWLG
jgi:hypothetical protein